MKMISKVRIEYDQNGMPIAPTSPSQKSGQLQAQSLQQSGQTQAQAMPQSDQLQAQAMPQSGQLQTQSSRLESDIQPCITKTEHFLHDNIIPREEVEEKLMKA